MANTYINYADWVSREYIKWLSALDQKQPKQKVRVCRKSKKRS